MYSSSDSNSEHPGQWSNRRILTMVALCTLIISAIWHLPEEAAYIGERTGEILFTLVLSLGFTYLLRPIVNWLQRLKPFYGSTHEAHHSGRVKATIAVYVLCGLAIYFTVKIGLRPVGQDALKLWHSIAPDGTHSNYFEALRESVRVAIQPFFDFLGPELTAKVEREAPEWLDKGVLYARDHLPDLVHHAGFIVELLLVPVLVFYFLCDGSAIRAEMRLLLPAEWRPRAARMADHLDRVLDGYIRGQVLMCLIAWVLVTIVLLALRVPHAFSLGVIAGLTRAVPIVGPLLGGIPLVLVCFISTKSLPTTGLLLAGFTLMHFLESKVLLPRIIGHEVDLHPVSVIIALLVGLEFFGFIGVFLSVPIAAVLKIILAEWHESRLRLQKLQSTAHLPSVVDRLAQEVTPTLGDTMKPESTT